ncbi:SURF1 family cytochrome oxidase biogenesis protein, partial [Bordetella pertussis]|uniref:SURF1 family cytochrome oxidase biogenesis protein n=1 Tax=Bordetella pertussis TaxID=520 RepID=UPI003144EF9F
MTYGTCLDTSHAAKRGRRPRTRHWVMTPLRLDGGGTVLVNRGFVLPEWRR